MQLHSNQSTMSPLNDSDDENGFDSSDEALCEILVGLSSLDGMAVMDER